MTVSYRKKKCLRNKIILLAFFLVPVTLSQGTSRSEKLPEPLNSDHGDLAPTVSANGKMLIFQSNRPNGKGNYDLYESSWQNDHWSEPQNITILNTRYFEGLPSLSADGQTLFFSTNRDYLRKAREAGDVENADRNDQDIYMAKRGVNGAWQRPVALDDLNSENYDATPSISFDGKTLYFASNRLGGEGNFDIWYSTLQSRGNWSAPRAMPAPINSEDNVFNPNILPAGDQFYFSSDRPGGFGAYDLYRVSRTSLNSEWSSPENIGNEINGSSNEYFFTLPATGDFIYISKGSLNREDIYKLDLPESLKPTPIIILSGKVQNEENDEPIENATVSFSARNRNELSVNLTSAESNGAIHGILVAGQEYNVTVNHAGFEPYQQVLDLRSLSRTYERILIIKLKPERQILNEFAGIFYKPYHCKLNDESRVAIQLYADYLREHQEKEIQIISSTDYNESSLYQLYFARKRAERVKSYLKSIGINDERIKIKEIVTGGNPAHRRNPARMQQHRRTRLIVTDH